MRVSLLLCLVFASLQCISQKKNDLINGTFNNVELELILDSITSQTDYFFSYNSDLLPKGSLYAISAENMPIDQFLSKLLVGTGLKYTFFKDQIILNYEPPEQVVLKKNFFSISGTVTDEKGMPLTDANIFLDGTTIGVSSDIDGNYRLESIPPGFYSIVFSYVGYENAVYQISENNGGARIQNHKMELDLGQLEEVEVISNRINKSETSWMHYYAVFRQEILGQSENAEQCVIENPEAINFSFDERDGSLMAFAQYPIQIRNDALGYRINYFLESFLKNKNDLRFRGKIRFSNLEPLNSTEKRLWRRNRKESYYGSLNHFKKSLLYGDLKKEGFRIYELKSIDNFKIDRNKELDISDVLVFKGDHYVLDFRNYFIVEYRKEKESEKILNHDEYVSLFYSDKITKDGILIHQPDNQISVLKLLRGSVRLDLSGEIMDRFGLATFGYWSWERTADLVPINYDPKFDDL